MSEKVKSTFDCYSGKSRIKGLVYITDKRLVFVGHDRSTSAEFLTDFVAKRLHPQNPLVQIKFKENGITLGFDTIALRSDFCTSLDEQLVDDTKSDEVEQIILQNHPHIRLAFDYVTVTTKSASARDFWDTNADVLAEYRSRDPEEAKPFLADPIKVASLSVLEAPESVPELEEQLRCVLEENENAAEAFRTLVPHKMTRVEFWARFLKSSLYQRMVGETPTERSDSLIVADVKQTVPDEVLYAECADVNLASNRGPWDAPEDRRGIELSLISRLNEYAAKATEDVVCDRERDVEDDLWRSGGPESVVSLKSEISKSRGAQQMNIKPLKDFAQNLKCQPYKVVPSGKSAREAFIQNSRIVQKSAQVEDKNLSGLFTDPESQAILEEAAAANQKLRALLRHLWNLDAKDTSRLVRVRNGLIELRDELERRVNENLTKGQLSMRACLQPVTEAATRNADIIQALLQMKG